MAETSCFDDYKQVSLAGMDSPKRLMNLITLSRGLRGAKVEGSRSQFPAPDYDDYVYFIIHLDGVSVPN